MGSKKNRSGFVGKTGRHHPRSQPVLQIHPFTKEIIKSWESMNIIEQTTGWNRSHISHCIKHKKTAYGFLWQKVQNKLLNNHIKDV